MIEILSERRYGEPKLKKPKELAGVKQCMSYKYNSKCSIPVYVVDDDIYIKHRDWCSIDIYNGKLYDEWIKNHPPKFIYNDTYGCVVLRGEAYIRIKDVLSAECIVPVIQKISLECVANNSRFNSDDERMFVDVTTRLWKEKNNR